MSDAHSARRASKTLTKVTTSEARARRAQARVGQTLCGKWRLDGLLGIGGMAAVYAATHKNGTRVAIKTLHADLAELPDVHERFVEEAYVANRVGHPGVVAVRDEGTAEDGTTFLVMELLEGETLDTRCTWGPGFSPREVLEIADQVLGVLIAAHDRGIIHRDIKPENVFVTLDGRVKVLDFGVARVTDSRRTHTTETGATIGTPAFMAPEQARGRWDMIDGRADLWSLGATLYFMLTGRLVREADTPNEELLSAMTEPVPSIREILSLPQTLAEIVDRALAFKPQDRFPNARSMQAAVRQALAALRDPGRQSHRPSPPIAALPSVSSRPRHSSVEDAPEPARVGWRAVLGAAAVMIGLGVGIAIWDGMKRPEPAARAPRDAWNGASEAGRIAVIAVETGNFVELPPEEEQLALHGPAEPESVSDESQTPPGEPKALGQAPVTEVSQHP